MYSSGGSLRRAKGPVRCIAALVALAGMVSMASALDPTIRYTFEPGGTPADNLTKAGGIHNRGTKKGKHDGTVITPSAAQFVPGPSGNMNAIHLDGIDDSSSSVGSGIAVDATTGDPDVNIQNGPFTVMAWVKRGNLYGDNMVFGTGDDGTDAGSLHMGFRYGHVYMGFWGNDSHGGGVLRNEWHHVAWRFDGSTTQDIFVDGELVSTDPGRSIYNDDRQLLVGRTTYNNGAYFGSLADVRVYNDKLSDADIAAIAASLP